MVPASAITSARDNPVVLTRVGVSHVIIIGGGAIGSSIAYHLLADPGFSGKVTVIERDPSYSRASSALSASSIRQQFSTPINIQIGLYGIAFLREASRLLAVTGQEPPLLGLVEPGYLFLASDDGAAILRENHQVQVREHAQIDLLEPSKLGARFPWLNVSDLALAAHGVRGEGWFDGYSLMQALRRKAISLGARYLHAAADGLNIRGGKVTAVRLADGQLLAADWVVNAAGPWARAVAAWAQINLPVFARRRTVFVFETAARLAHCPLVIDPSGVWFRPEQQRFICGVSPHPSNDPDEPPLEPEHGLFDERIWPVLAHRVPRFEALRQTRAWAGYYEMNTFDANGIVGPHPSLSNFIFANGFSGHGIQQSPAVGRGISELIVAGAYRTLDLSALGFGRLLSGRPLLERNIV